MHVLSSLPLVPLLLATALATHGLRKKSLSPSGALAAFLVGSLMLSPLVHTFGISLLVFYLVGSRATKVGKHTKAAREEGHTEAGYRTAAQVLCNSFAAFGACVLWTGMFDPKSYAAGVLPAALREQGEPYAGGGWCALSQDRGNGWSRWLLFVALGHFACCLGDTLASELGILANTPPVLITSFKRVPPGTNGGISTLGTAASAAGGLIMGTTMALSLVLENAACRRVWPTLLGELVLKGMIAGVFGSLIDSLMGATIQRTRYSNATKRVLQDDTVVSTPADIKIVSGLNLLTNNQVNLVSSIITAFATAWYLA
ncbi:hypothetical protein M0805_009917 [Coniferiporia weirii]|nr:hypothetical protein M0805_009917 [Coniferiporia weirii]